MIFRLVFGILVGGSAYALIALLTAGLCDASHTEDE